MVKQVRVVARCPAHVTHETTRSLYARLQLEDPLAALASSLTKRLATNRAELSHLQPPVVHQWWNQLWSSFSCHAWGREQGPSGPDRQGSPIEVTQVAAFRCVCNQCGQYFPSSRALSVHIGKQHPASRPPKARSTREKNVRCETYRQHALQGMPQCRHCGKKFYGWLQFRGHFSQQACPILHDSSSAVDQSVVVTHTSRLTVTTQNVVESEAPDAGAPASGSVGTPPPPDVPLFDRPALQKLARQNTLRELAAAIASTNSAHHCPQCFQWMAKPS